MAADADALKQAVCDRVDQLADVLIDASHQIHANPELNYEEHFAHGLLTDLLAAQGVEPVRHAYDLATAFDSSYGSGGPVVAVLCEYDALPGVGHAPYLEDPAGYAAALAPFLEAPF